MSQFEQLLGELKANAGLHRDSAETLYAQLADALSEAIRSGKLKPGDRLPPHREFASALELNITTITKAMAVLQQKGLVESRPGRGTQVAQPRHPAAQFQSAPSNDPGTVDLSVNRPATDGFNRVLAQLLPRLSSDSRFVDMKDYHPSEGPLWAREAAAQWLRHTGVQAEARQVLIVEGAQHGIASTLRSLTSSGDVILADSVTYQGINALCRSLGLILVGVDSDARGMCPDALREACTEHQPRLLFLVPSIHNPTAITLDTERREELAAVIRETNLLVIEDDVYRPLLDQSPPPIASMLPERTIYVSALSKCIAPGLRMGFVVAPLALVQDIAAMQRIDCWSTSPFTALIATRLIEDGHAEQLVAEQREELRSRQALLAAHLEGLEFQHSATGTHAWLILPEPWTGSRFARLCQDRGVVLLAGGAFTLRPELSPQAVRINISAALSREQLVKALKEISQLARQGHLYMHNRI
ncbi:PLP-dependent aminotransferase family protein [Metapseudomonas lalkuanensis]|uniref:PLP-dependent aminotransferase family protein n=1 Tax=Metapseudomonas lalkuanensis TaxID=2604832 RepID=A0A5J6QLG4_9GAMM|nr:PLP-dependent aminotransferase family protein [Pseudomonas lalkuanensis]QEY63237.1 PLP-dependent aminotransferase family protein [Pseudomonas lalkuanensis]